MSRWEQEVYSAFAEVRRGHWLWIGLGRILWGRLQWVALLSALKHFGCLVLHYLFRRIGWRKLSGARTKNNQFVGFLKLDYFVNAFIPIVISCFAKPCNWFCRTSPDFDGQKKYKPNLDCYWLIEATAGASLTIEMIKFGLEKSTEFVFHFDNYSNFYAAQGYDQTRQKGTTWNCIIFREIQLNSVHVI